MLTTLNDREEKAIRDILTSGNLRCDDPLAGELLNKVYYEGFLGVDGNGMVYLPIESPPADLDTTAKFVHSVFWDAARERLMPGECLGENWLLCSVEVPEGGFTYPDDE